MPMALDVAVAKGLRSFQNVGLSASKLGQPSRLNSSRGWSRGHRLGGGGAAAAQWDLQERRGHLGPAYRRGPMNGPVTR